jgi:hypothetical protein
MTIIDAADKFSHGSNPELVQRVKNAVVVAITRAVERGLGLKDPQMITIMADARRAEIDRYYAELANNPPSAA